MGKFDDMRDDFWDLERIMPKKKKMTTFNTSTFARDHQIEGSETPESEHGKLTMLGFNKATEQAEEHSYIPDDEGLIKRITIKRFPDRYDFYGNFRKAAIVYRDHKTEKCDFVPFYSYMPQYSQMTTEQKQYYFYFRDMFRRGRYVKSDYSYLYLLVYEILNMPDYIPPSEGIILLCRLWREYRMALPKIDPYFASWIQDYCMVHAVKCPMDMISEFIFDVISASDFKEFYLSAMGASGAGRTDAMIAYLSDYDWRKCRYRTPDNKKLYFIHMTGAMDRLFDILFDKKIEAESNKNYLIIEREAFVHSLCTHALKCRLVIEYVPLSRDSKMRECVTMGVRYAENKLRAMFGVKSRLAIKDFSSEYKAAIDSYFESFYVAEAKREKAKNIPEYEKLYDAPHEEISFEGADEIERASWSTTARLVSEEIFDVEESLPESLCVIRETKSQEYIDSTSETTVQDNTVLTDDYGLSNKEISIIADIIKGRIDCGDVIIDNMIDNINEIFADKFGDIIIESDGAKWCIIDDYREETEEWLMKLKK